MPEVIRRQKEGVTEGDRFNMRTSPGLAAAIRARAKAEGFENPVHWLRDAVAKLVGYEAPLEETQRPPWEVPEGGEEAPPIDVRSCCGTPRGEPHVAECPGNAPEFARPPPPALTTTKKRGGSRAKKAKPIPPKVPPTDGPTRGEPPLPSLLQLAKGALRRLLT